MCDWSACLTGQPSTLQCLHDSCTSSVGSQTVSNPWALTTGAAAETRPYRARQGALPALLRQVQAFAADAKRCRGSAGEKRRPLAGGEDSQETLRGDVALYMFFFNYERPHAALAYRTPNEYLVAPEAARSLGAICSEPVHGVDHPLSSWKSGQTTPWLLKGRT